MPGICLFILPVALLCISAILSVVSPGKVLAQNESGRTIYHQRNISSGYFEESDVTSSFYSPLVGGPSPGRRYINLPPKAGTYRRWRTFLADSHYGIRILKLQTCSDCHTREARNMHTVRAGITCRQCHGEEPIAGINHYYSPMNLTRRHAYVCSKCHEGANNSYATYVVHSPNPAALATMSTFPMLFYVFWLIVAVAAGTFVVFLPQTLLWGIKDFMTKKVKKGEIRIRRFTLSQRLFHLLLMLSFVTQAATGLARMFIETQWGRLLAALFGGYERALYIHKGVGIFMLVLFITHIFYLAVKVDWHRFPSSLAGPDSILPKFSDICKAVRHFGWFLGKESLPQFDRWSYWEKFDYWAVFWGMAILGGTGLFLAYSLGVTHVFPGWSLNVALWIHRAEAILAIVHVFIIHFFVAHLRRHTFPMDRSMFEGSVDLNVLRHERSPWIERLEKSGKLEDVLVDEATRGRRLLFYFFGCIIVAFGLFLLVGGIFNISYITF